MISFVRVDNRLIHGQVIEAWLPALQISRVVVADDEVARNSLAQAAMGLAVPGRISVKVTPLNGAKLSDLDSSPEPALLLVRDVKDALHARELGVRCPRVTVGNVHFAPGRVQISPSVFLGPEELESLKTLAKAGVTVELQTVPKDKPLSLAEMEAHMMAPPHVHHKL
jgi:PTS system mannose-specific IIB component